MLYDMNPYTLPTIEFVGGESQELLFHTYFYRGRKPFSMTGCTSNFSIVDFRNKSGSPILTKSMNVLENADGSSFNVLSVELSPMETYELSGKYIYQITIRDVNGNMEIPKQGLMYITNNINKGFIQHYPAN